MRWMLVVVGLLFSANMLATRKQVREELLGPMHAARPLRGEMIKFTAIV